MNIYVYIVCGWVRVLGGGRCVGVGEWDCFQWKWDNSFRVNAAGEGRWNYVYMVCFVFSHPAPPIFFLSFALFTPSRCNELDIVCGMKVANEIVSSGNGKLALCSRGSVKGGWNCVTGFGSRQDLSSGLSLRILTPLSLFIMVEMREGGIIVFSFVGIFFSRLFSNSIL